MYAPQFHRDVQFFHFSDSDFCLINFYQVNLYGERMDASDYPGITFSSIEELYVCLTSIDKAKQKIITFHGFSLTSVSHNFRLSLSALAMNRLQLKNGIPLLTMSPSPNIEKWPVWYRLGNTNFPGSESLGASLTTPPIWSLRATMLTGFSAGRVATCREKCNVINSNRVPPRTEITQKNNEEENYGQ